MESAEDAHGELRGIIGVGDGERLPAFLTIDDFDAQISAIFKRHRNGIAAGDVPKAHLNVNYGMMPLS